MLSLAAHCKRYEVFGRERVVQRQHPGRLVGMMGGGYNLGDVGPHRKNAAGNCLQRLGRFGAVRVVVRKDHLAAIVQRKLLQPEQLVSGEIHIDINIVGAGNNGGGKHPHGHIHLGAVGLGIIVAEVQMICLGRILYAIGGHHGAIPAAGKEIFDVVGVKNEVVKPQLHSVRADIRQCPGTAVIDIHLAEAVAR